MNDWIAVAGERLAYIDDEGSVILVDYDLTAVRLLLPAEAIIIRLNEQYLFVLDANNELHVFSGTNRVYSLSNVKNIALDKSSDESFIYIDNQDRIFSVNLFRGISIIIAQSPQTGAIKHFNVVNYVAESIPQIYIVYDDGQNNVLVYHDMWINDKSSYSDVTVNPVTSNWLLFHFKDPIWQIESGYNGLYVLSGSTIWVISSNLPVTTFTPFWLKDTLDIAFFNISRRGRFNAITVDNITFIDTSPEKIIGEPFIFIQSGIYKRKEYYILLGKSGTFYQISDNRFLTKLDINIVREIDMTGES